MSVSDSSGQITFLASGSSGNACLLEADGFGLLIDFGLVPSAITSRLSAIHRTWSHIHAVLLSHTHGDHWNQHTLKHLRTLNIPLYLHAKHAAHLASSPAYEPMVRAGLVHHYEHLLPLALYSSLTCVPVVVPHDSDPTFAFRLERVFPDHLSWVVGYASDLGCIPPLLADVFQDCDLLGVEFNHDVELQKQSPRPSFLIQRVLSNQGHLSNEQALAFVSQLKMTSIPSRLTTVVALHLSRECNSADLVHQCYERLALQFPELNFAIAKQDKVVGPFLLEPRSSTGVKRSLLQKRSQQPSLPGMDDKHDDLGMM